MKSNAIIETKTGLTLNARVTINGMEEWDDNPELGIKRLYKTGRQSYPNNPINIESITIQVNGKGYTFSAAGVEEEFAIQEIFHDLDGKEITKDIVVEIPYHKSRTYFLLEVKPAMRHGKLVMGGYYLTQDFRVDQRARGQVVSVPLDKIRVIGQRYQYEDLRTLPRR